MKENTTFYKDQITIYKYAFAKSSKTLKVVSLLRLLSFLLLGYGVYIWFSNTVLGIVMTIVGLVGFLFLLNKYVKEKQHQLLQKALLTVNEEELRIYQGDFLFKPEGDEYQSPNHAYALDIDLFGRGSFFQFINRTILKNGTKKLVDALTANNIKDISQRQEAIKDLSSKTQWRQNYQASASLVETNVEISSVVKWMTTYSSKLPKFSVFLSFSFSFLSLIFLVAVSFKLIPIAFFGYWLLLGLGITAKYLKAVNQLSQYIGKSKTLFKQYSDLLLAIEETKFTSELLQQKQQEISTNDVAASKLFKQLSRHIDALDNRNNLIGAIFGNGFFLLDIRNAKRIEQWIETNNTTVANWFDVVATFEAYNSLGNFAFNHPMYSYPKIVNEAGIKALEIGHPLISEDKRITSNVEIKPDEFFIITGANMAGKSTFLRTIALHIVMANMGLPVCAKESFYRPIKLITSMRTTDNLTDESSYFFSELTRLKYIVDTIKTDNYFIILDEILKGTNSKDKAEGSKKFVEKLVESKATGIIATHDLSLCETANTFKEVKNYYFDAQIINDELFFDYKLKTGICKNMNASFLLKKMEIV